MLYQLFAAAAAAAVVLQSICFIRTSTVNAAMVHSLVIYCFVMIVSEVPKLEYRETHEEAKPQQFAVTNQGMYK